MQEVERAPAVDGVPAVEELDRRPVGQAEGWFTALRSAGVPTELVRYPGGSHLFILSGPPSHRVDYARRVEEWVVHYAERRESGAPKRRLQERLRCGTNCGSCLPELQRLVRRSMAAA